MVDGVAPSVSDAVTDWLIVGVMLWVPETLGVSVRDSEEVLEADPVMEGDLVEVCDTDTDLEKDTVCELDLDTVAVLVVLIEGDADREVERLTLIEDEEEYDLVTDALRLALRDNDIDFVGVLVVLPEEVSVRDAVGVERKEGDGTPVPECEGD